MMTSPFQQKPKQLQEKDNCRIKIKNTARGREIEFKGKCSKEEIEVAKGNL